MGMGMGMRDAGGGMREEECGRRDPTWQSDYGIVAQQSSGSLMLYCTVSLFPVSHNGCFQSVPAKCETWLTSSVKLIPKVKVNSGRKIKETSR
jgi:hypothetical protein